MEFAVYCKWFDWLIQNQKPELDLIIYLRSSPKTCFERLKVCLLFIYFEFGRNLLVQGD